MIDIRPVDHSGPAFVLRDPLQLADSYVVVPQAFGPLLALLDGSGTYAELYAFVEAQIGAVSGPALLQHLLDTLDQALLLDNPNFEAALEAARATYRAAPARTPALAGLSYPNSPAELQRLLDGLLDQAGDVELSAPTSRALLSPHIDYPRGGATYAQAWKSAAEAARTAELVLLLATDHQSAQPFTLTRQRYATPYGVLPTDDALVDMLAEAVGPHAFAAELYHRSEHSVELVATWLHHMRGGRPCTVVPILCGSFYRFTHQAGPAHADPQLADLAAALQSILAERQALVVISGDLAHVGPAFGDSPLDPVGEARLRADDEALLATLCAGDAEAMLHTVRAVRDRNKICGLPPAYVALRALGPTQGAIFGYDRCPADDDNTSAVTVAGAIFT
jgi:AmmeMemoRadiSam system protein B